MKQARVCDQCHGELPGDAPEELCPKCLLKLGGAELGILVKRQEAGAEVHGSEAAGRKFGKYEVLEKIAQGGMGAVYKARQLNLDRLVALKLLPFGQFSRDDLLQRFRSEASAAAALQHPNIVAVHDVGEHDGQPFFSMDFVEGRTLAELVRDQPLPAKRAAAYLKTIAEAVHYAHQHGILHRDLKPSNILIDTSDQPRITDFGLAKRLGGDSDLTLTGQVLGSPNFISPEQAEGRSDAIGPPSDVYSLGALLYHLLTRQPPFQADTLTTLLRQVLEAEPVPPCSLNPSIPNDLETVCLKCLEKEPARRYPTAQALADDLGRFLRAEPVRARPIGAAGKSWRWCRRQPVRAGLIAGLAVAVMLGIAGISWQWRRAERERSTALDNEALAWRQAYASDINLVQRSLEEGDLGQARRLLDMYRPAASSPSTLNPQLSTDLRGWEWRYLWGLSRSDEQYQLTHQSNGFANLALAPDGKLLALREGGGNIQLWDLGLRQRIGTLTNQGLAWAMAFSPDGNLLASGNRDASGKPVISLWQLATRQILRNLPQSDDVTSLAFSPDGKCLATYQMEAVPRMRLWELPAGRLVKELPASEPINAQMRVPVFSPNGKTLALGEMLGEIRLLDLATGAMRTLPPPREGNGVSTLAFSLDGRFLAAGYGFSDGPIRLWDVATTNLAASLEGHRSYVNKVVFAPDGQTLYSASADQSIRTWDLTQKKQVGRLQGHIAEVTGLALCPGSGTLVSCSADGSVLVWDPRSPSRHRSQDTLPGLGWVFGAEFTADSRRIITAGLTNPVTIRDVATADPIARIPALGTSNLSLTLSPDERLVAVGGADGTLKIADLRTQRLVKEWHPHRFPVITVWFVRGGTALFSCGWIAHQQFEPKLWDAASWKEIPCALTTPKPVYGIALSRDHRLIAVAYAGEPIKIWDTVSGRLDALPGSEGAMGPGFSADTRLLAAAFGSRVRIWEVRTGRELPPVNQPLNKVASAAFSPDGKRLVTSLATSGDIQPALRVWDYQVGRDLLSLHGHGAWTQRTEFSPDGNSVLAVSYYGVADLWRAPSWAEIEAAEKEQKAP